MLTRSTGKLRFLLCALSLLHHHWDCVPASCAVNGITTYLSHVAWPFIPCQGETGMCHVLVGVLFAFKGYVTICLCYKRQAGWRAG